MSVMSETCEACRQPVEIGDGEACSDCGRENAPVIEPGADAETLPGRAMSSAPFADTEAILRASSVTPATATQPGGRRVASTGATPDWCTAHGAATDAATEATVRPTASAGRRCDDRSEDGKLSAARLSEAAMSAARREMAYLDRREVERILAEKPPPIWRQILTAPFSSAGRTAATVIVLILSASVLLVRRGVERHETESATANATDSGFAGSGIALPSGFDPYGPVTRAVDPRRAKKVADARRDLTKIADALRAFARQYGSFPDALGPTLSELGEFTAPSGLLQRFEGAKLESYERRLALDLRTETAVVRAVVAGVGESLEIEVKYRRRP